jgi:23S rRNA (adenine2503-C2)-methyltransferase
MPVTKDNPLENLLNVSDNYTSSSNTWLTFEYVLIKDCNDDLRDADRLITILSGINKCKLNVIPYNMTDGTFQRPDEQQIKLFMKKLNNAPFPVTIRWSKGTDIDAGCGQLAISDNLMNT